MNTSPVTTRYGVLGAVGTGVAARGTGLVGITVATPGAPSWLPLAGAILVAVGGGLSAFAKALGGAAARDNGVSDEAAGALPGDAMGETPKPPGAR